MGLFAVVDGMGGHANGEIASRAVAEAVLEFIRNTAVDPEKTWPAGMDPELSVPANRLQIAIRSANRRLADLISQGDASGRTGATISAALLTSNGLVVSNVGDCRVYLLRDGHGWQITRDHSLVGEQIASGALSPEEARKHPTRHIVTRAVSGNDELAVDTWEVRVKKGDRLLLCSDGLHSAMDYEDLVRIAGASMAPLSETCQQLLQAANQRGGADNATVVLIEVEDDGEREPKEA